MALSTMSLSEFVHSTDHVYQACQGDILAKHLSLSDEHVSNENLWGGNIASLVMGKCVIPLDNLIINHLLAVKCLYGQDFVGAFSHQVAYVNSIVKVMQTQAGNWMLPVMYAACVDLRLTGQRADIISQSRGALLEKAAQTMMGCFSLCLEDTLKPIEKSKKKGLLFVVNHIIRIYCRIEKFNLCPPIIRAAEPLVVSSLFPVTQKITFRFYVGRLTAIEGNFRSAEQNFIFAFRHCHPSSYKNRRMILFYLLPIKMILGYMPTKRFVEKYNLPVYWDLVMAVKGGNLRRFDHITNSNRRFFYNIGIHAVLETLRNITNRNICKQVYLTENSNRIPVNTFKAGLQMMTDKPIDRAEATSIIVNLIHSNKMKAYINYETRVVILSVNEPFPRLSTLHYIG